MLRGCPHNSLCRYFSVISHVPGVTTTVLKNPAGLCSMMINPSCSFALWIQFFPPNFIQLYWYHINDEYYATVCRWPIKLCLCEIHKYTQVHLSCCQCAARSSVWTWCNHDILYQIHPNFIWHAPDKENKIPSIYPERIYLFIFCSEIW